ncbi:unnamed protein product [Symbiodinium sp. CCMP2592]|nr:unnamed protein product [Symbiodinium sp. CCMP2592]
MTLVMAPEDLGRTSSALEAPRIIPRAPRLAVPDQDGNLRIDEAHVQLIQPDQAAATRNLPPEQVASSNGLTSLQELQYQAHLEQQLLQSRLQQLHGTDASFGGLLQPSQCPFLHQNANQNGVPNFWMPHVPMPESLHPSPFARAPQHCQQCVNHQVAQPPHSWQSWQCQCNHGNPNPPAGMAPCLEPQPHSDLSAFQEPVTQVQSMGNDMLPSLLPPRGLDAPKLVLKPLVPPPPVSAPLGPHPVEMGLAWPEQQGQGHRAPAQAPTLPPMGGVTQSEHSWPMTAGASGHCGDPGLHRMAGVTAKQDKEILDTLHSSGFAVDFGSADPRSDRDLGQMIDTMATQGSAQSASEVQAARSWASRSGRPLEQVTENAEISGLSSSRPDRAASKPLPHRADVQLRSGPLVAAEEFLRSYRPQMHLQSLVYPNGTKVDFTELAPVLRAVAVANSQSAARMLQAIESGSHVRTALQVFRECDADGCGFLTWSNGGIRDFVMAVFTQLGLVPPAEMQTYAAHTLFDMNRTMCLSACDCLCLTDTLLRAIFLFSSEDAPTMQAEPAAKVRSSGSKRSPRPVVPVAEELAEAQAETERLRQELEELQAAEAQADAMAADDKEVLGPEVLSARHGRGIGDTSALVWTARAHAENSRLERELKSLRSLANRQRGEVHWLHELRQQLQTACRQEELEREHQQLMELQEEDAEGELRERDLERRREQRLEALVQERQERRERIEQRERELQEQELAHDLEQQRLMRKEQDLQQRERELRKEREKRLQQAEALRGHELEFSRELGRLKGSSSPPLQRAEEMASPPSASSDRLEPEEEAEADSAEVAAQAAAQTLENRKLRRELESLRALAQWQQSEVGAVLACRPGDLTRRPADEMPDSQGQQVVGSSRPRGSLVMAALAGEALVERAERDGALQAPAVEGMDGTGRRLGWRPEPCGQDAAALHFRQQGLRNGIQEYDRTVRELMSRVLGRADDAGHGSHPENRVTEPLAT